MRLFRMLVWIVLCGTFVLPVAYGQLEPRMHVNVPFNFHVADKEFTAGEYTVNASPGGAAVLLQSTDLRRAQFVLTNPVQASAFKTQPSLVFNRYGKEYFLSTIWMAGSATGRQLPRSRQETEAAQARPEPGTKTLVGQIEPKR